MQLTAGSYHSGPDTNAESVKKTQFQNLTLDYGDVVFILFTVPATIPRQIGEFYKGAELPWEGSVTNRAAMSS